MRRNLIIFILTVVLLSVVYFFLVWRPQSGRISETKEQAEATEQEIEQAKLEIARLKALRDRAPELRQQAAKLDAALPGDPQLAQFILMVQDTANASGIDWLSISPSPPAAGQAPAPPDVLIVNISMSVTGGYFQVQDFLVRIENLTRAVRIDSMSLGAGPKGLPHLAAGLSMKMFVAAPVPAPVATPAATPAG